MFIAKLFISQSIISICDRTFLSVTSCCGITPPLARALRPSPPFAFLAPLTMRGSFVHVGPWFPCSHTIRSCSRSPPLFLTKTPTIEAFLQCCGKWITRVSICITPVVNIPFNRTLQDSVYYSLISVIFVWFHNWCILFESVCQKLNIIE